MDAMDLAAMVRPASGRPAEPQDIWDKVQDSDGARLPGEWDATVTGAMDAARRGNWALCAYLAAVCYQEAGAEALAAPDARMRDSMWLCAASPTVLEVPLGSERLWVKLDAEDKPEWISSDQLEISPFETERVLVRRRGAGWLVRGSNRSSERFNAGERLELSQLDLRPWSGPQSSVRQAYHPTRGQLAPGCTTFRCLRLKPNDVRDLRRLVPDSSGDAQVAPDEEEAFWAERLARLESSWSKATKKLYALLWTSLPATGLLRVFWAWRMKKAKLGKISAGGQHHVLAYPFAGDLTKVLVRPKGRPQAEAAVLKTLGATLISQCAKSGQWALAATLLRAGVPCPDLAEEFADVCGLDPAVRRAWCRELAAAGAGPGLSLLSFAASAENDRPLEALSEALERSCLQELLERCLVGRRPLLEALALRGRWGSMRLVLEGMSDKDGASVVPLGRLLDSPILSKAPRDIQELVDQELERMRRFGERSRSLKEYFERQVRGETLHPSTAPPGFRQVGEGATSVLDGRAPGGSVPLTVLAHAVCLESGGAAGAPQLCFVSVAEEEFREASGQGDPSGVQIVPVDLNGKVAEMSHPGDSGSHWLAVLCPTGFLKQDGNGGTVLSIPSTHFSSPHVPQANVVVEVVTPCCHKPMGQLCILVDGRRAGLTDDCGRLELALLPGRHVLHAPDVSSPAETVDVRWGAVEHVQLQGSGEVFLFITDSGGGHCEERDHAITAVARRDHVPVVAEPMELPLSMLLRPAAGSSTSVSRKDFRPAFAVRKGTGCAVQILKMQEGLGLYAHAREKRYLAMFVSSDDSLLQLCFQGWLLQSRTQRAKRLPGAERIGFKPDPGKAVWIQRSECAISAIANLPLRLGTFEAEAASLPGSPVARHVGRLTGGSRASVSLRRATSAGARTPRPQSARGGKPPHPFLEYHRRVYGNSQPKAVATGVHQRPPSGRASETSCRELALSRAPRPDLGRPEWDPDKTDARKRASDPKGSRIRPASAGASVRSVASPMRALSLASPIRAGSIRVGSPGLWGAASRLAGSPDRGGRLTPRRFVFDPYENDVVLA